MLEQPVERGLVGQRVGKQSPVSVQVRQLQAGKPINFISGTINRGALTLLCIVAIHHPMLTKVFLNVLLTG